MFLLLVIALLTSKQIYIQAQVEHKYYWRDYRGSLPNDAVNFTANLYVGQVYYEGILPGTFHQIRKEVVTECRGQKRIVKVPIKILCDKRKDNFEWEHVNVNWLVGIKLQDMVVGGYEVGHTLYVGRVFHEGEWKIGKVFTPPYQFKGLTVWHNDGRQYITHDFEILKYLGKKIDVVEECQKIYYPIDIRSHR